MIFCFAEADIISLFLFGIRLLKRNASHDKKWKNIYVYSQIHLNLWFFLLCKSESYSASQNVYFFHLLAAILPLTINIHLLSVNNMLIADRQQQQQQQYSSSKKKIESTQKNKILNRIIQEIFLFHRNKCVKIEEHFTKVVLCSRIHSLGVKCTITYFSSAWFHSFRICAEQKQEK